VTIVVERGQGPSDVTAATPVVAVEMPNESSVKGPRWGEFRVSADQVERDSGYDFLAALADEMEARLEARVWGERSSLGGAAAAEL
jgi:endonuclease G